MPFFSAIWFLGDDENRERGGEEEDDGGAHCRGLRLNRDTTDEGGNANRCDHFSHGPI